MPVKILNVLFLLKQRLHLKHSLCLIADYFISKLCCLVFLFLLKKVESLEIVIFFFFYFCLNIIILTIIFTDILHMWTKEEKNLVKTG